MHIRGALLVMTGLLLAASAVQARPMTDAQVRRQIIREAIAAYHGRCPCPYSKDRHGRRCGDHSEYSRQGSNIQCYPRDITDTGVDAWRSDHGATGR